jgi:hypothetical protein
MHKKYNSIPEISELTKLEEKMKIQRMQLNLEHLEENILKERTIRDSRAAVMGNDQTGKRFKF